MQEAAHHWGGREQRAVNERRRDESLARCTRYFLTTGRSRLLGTRSREGIRGNGPAISRGTRNPGVNASTPGG